MMSSSSRLDPGEGEKQHCGLNLLVKVWIGQPVSFSACTPLGLKPLKKNPTHALSFCACSRTHAHLHRTRFLKGRLSNPSFFLYGLRLFCRGSKGFLANVKDSFCRLLKIFHGPRPERADLSCFCSQRFIRDCVGGSPKPSSQ